MVSVHRQANWGAQSEASAHRTDDRLRKERAPDESPTIEIVAELSEARGVTIVAVTADQELRSALIEVLPRDSIVFADSPEQVLSRPVPSNCGVLIVEQGLSRPTFEQLKTYLKSSAPALVNIMVGTHDDGSSLIGLLSTGCIDRFMTKPFKHGPTRSALRSALQQHHSLRPRVKIDQANRDTKAHESLESTAANKQRMASSNTHDQLMRSEKPKVAVLAKRPVVQSTRHEVAEPSEVALEQVPDAVAPARESTKRVAAASLTSRPASWGLAIAAVIAVTALVASGLVAWVMSTRTAEVDVNQAMVAKIVAGHLAAAQRAFELGSYVDPPGLSAIHFYNAVLELDPVNEPAKSGLNAVADRLLADSKQLIASGDLLYAQSTLDNLRRIEPNHPELPDVTAALLSARQAERLTIQAAYATTVPSTAAVAVATAPTGAAKRPIAVNKDDNKIRAQGPVSSSSLADNGSNTRVVDDATLSTRDKPTDQELFAANLMNTSEGKFVGPVLDAAELRAPAIAAALQEAGIPARIPEDAIASTSSLAPSDQTTSALSKPKLIKYVPPEYPDKARAANLEGWLDVNFLVTSDGSVVSPRIVSGTLGNKFHRPALAAVTQWKFLPANGAANRPMNVRLEFKLAK